jgi:hypothetical protein
MGWRIGRIVLATIVALAAVAAMREIVGQSLLVAAKSG